MVSEVERLAGPALIPLNPTAPGGASAYLLSPLSMGTLQMSRVGWTHGQSGRPCFRAEVFPGHWFT
jgi:hypothetical protein